jgi:peptidyl-prolyl cis-trans isomerase A (cyclophilin A)
MRSALLAAALILLASACAGNPGAASVAAPPAGDAAAIAAITAIPDSAFARADSFLVRFETSKGPFDLMVRRHWAPNGAVRVGEAVRAHYYDGARFFRALRGFVVQWGLAADSASTAHWRGRSIPDDTVRFSNRRMTVSFAAGGSNTRTVQLFINLRDNARLDAMGFSPIGEIVNGIDVVNAIYTGYGEGGAGGGPTQPRITNEGEAYLARDFPLLDRIVSARVVRVFPARP